jgi:hypothetical protein
VKTREEIQRNKERIASLKKKHFRGLEEGLDRCKESS